MKRMRLWKQLAVVMAFTMTAALGGCAAKNESTESTAGTDLTTTEGSAASQLETEVDTDYFASWNESEVVEVLQEYVTDVTDEGSENYIPVEDRIAVFDFDGTMIGEHFPTYFDWIMYCNRVLDDPDYEATEEQIEVAGQIVSSARAMSTNTGEIPSNLEQDHFLCNGEVYAGMTIDEFRSYVADFLTQEADCFDGLTYGEAYFRPMKEIVEYLQDNAFTVYIVSGTDREAVRVFASTFLNIPLRQVIGSDFYTIGSEQGEQDYLEYQFADGEDVIRTAEPIIKTVKMSKVMQMEQELGQQPVLAFGNSTGDLSMFMYATSDNPYRSAAFCVVPDDGDREYAYPEKVDNLVSICESNGWHTISMQDDFKTIYGENVTRNLENTPWMDRMEQLLEEAGYTAQEE